METTLRRDLKRVEHSPKPTEAVGRLNHSVQSLARNYLNLFKLYAQDGAGVYAQQIVKGAVAGVFLLMGWNMFVVASIFLVTPAIPLWASIGFWALFHLGIGVYILVKIRNDMKMTMDESKNRPKPIEPLKTSAERDPFFYGGGFVP